MEEKLNELLEKAELKLIAYDRERVEINHKMSFLKEHGFNKELDWLQHKKNAMSDLFYDYRETVQNIRDLLNEWLS